MKTNQNQLSGTRDRCRHAVVGFQWPWCIHINGRRGYQTFKAFDFSELNSNQSYLSIDWKISLSCFRGIMGVIMRNYQIQDIQPKWCQHVFQKESQFCAWMESTTQAFGGGRRRHRMLPIISAFHVAHPTHLPTFWSHQLKHLENIVEGKSD